MGSHLVHFYEDEASYAYLVGSFIEGALRAGDRCIVVATKAHRNCLEDELTARGFLDGSAASECYVALDAAETLSRFMVEGWPDAKRFSDVIGGIIGDAGKRGNGRVRVFGEMVALLYAGGKPEAAIHLENLWNKVAKLHSFSLLCAYPLGPLLMEERRVSLRHICAEHSGLSLPKQWGPQYFREALVET